MCQPGVSVCHQMRATKLKGSRVQAGRRQKKKKKKKRNKKRKEKERKKEKGKGLAGNQGNPGH